MGMLLIPPNMLAEAHCQEERGINTEAGSVPPE